MIRKLVFLKKYNIHIFIHIYTLHVYLSFNQVKKEEFKKYALMISP